MITSSSEYKTAVFAPTREVKSRVNLNMSALSSQPAQVIPLAPSNMVGKISGSTVENGNIYKALNSGTLGAPSAFTFEPAQASYNNLMTLDGTTTSSFNVVNGQMAQVLFSFDIIKFLEARLGKAIWNGATTLSAKITIAKTLVTSWTYNWYGWNSSPLGNKSYISVWNPVGSAWGTPLTNTASAVTLLTTTSTSSSFIDANGFMHFNAYADASDGVTNSTARTDYVELLLTVTQTTTRTYYDDRVIRANIVEEVDVLNLTAPANQLSLDLDNTDDFFNFLTLSNMATIIASKPKLTIDFMVTLPSGSIEWIPMGVFILDNWKNNAGQMSITFTAHDYLYVLSNIVYPITPATTNMLNLATNILTNAGFASTDFSLDSSMSSFAGNSRNTWTTNSRELLQMIGILTGTTLYVDRNGLIKMEKFVPLQANITSLTFPATQTRLYGRYTSSYAYSYPKVNTEGGMKTLPFDQHYDIPEVTLDQSVYQVNINIYSTNPAITTPTSTVTYTNSALGGNSGYAFEIDIPMLTSTTDAQTIANRIFTETNYYAIYLSRWRQNPVLVATDVVQVFDSVSSSKQTRVTKQEFIYEGYLKGNSESRGGV